MVRSGSDVVEHLRARPGAPASRSSPRRRRAARRARWVIARSPWRKPGTGGTTPMLPATGSTRTAAMSRPRAAKIASTAARSLNGATSVSATVAGVTPGESGRPSVATPEPAAARSGVGVAVVAAVELDDRSAAGRRARESHGAHRGLGAGAHESHHLERWERRHDSLREPNLELGRRAVGRAAALPPRPPPPALRDARGRG